MAQLLVGAATFLVGGLFSSNKTQRVTGPRVNDLTIQTSTYGNAIPIIKGVDVATGNMIWSTPINEVSTTTTKKSGGKGGGGTKVKTTTFEYFASFAIAFCQGEMDDVLSIWFDNRLVYQTSLTAAQVDPLSAQRRARLLNTQKGGNFRFYPGSETQTPDYLVVQDVGADWAPAHRGLCYIMFDNIELSEFGGRIPTVKAKLAQSSTYGDVIDTGVQTINKNTSFQWPVLAVDKKRWLAYALGDTGNSMYRVRLDTMAIDMELSAAECTANGITPWGDLGAVLPEGGIICPGDSGGAVPNSIYVIDPVTFTVEDAVGWGGVNGPEFPTIHPPNTCKGLLFDTQHFFAQGVLNKIDLFKYEKRNDLLPGELEMVWRGPPVAKDGTTLSMVWRGCTPGKSYYGESQFYVKVGPTPLSTADTHAVYRATVDVNAAYNDDATGQVGVVWEYWDIPKASLGIASGSVMEAGSPDGILYCPYDDTIVSSANGHSIDDNSEVTVIFKFDPNANDGAGEIVWAVPYADDGNQIPFRAEFASLAGTSFKFIKAVDYVRTLDTLTGVISMGHDVSPQPYPGSPNIYVGEYNMLVSLTAQGDVFWRGFLDMTDGDSVPLSEVVSDICDRCGLEPGTYDVTDLVDDTVRGFKSGTLSTGSELLSPFAETYFFDMVESDDVLKFSQRPKTSSVTITEDDMIVLDDKGEFYQETQVQEVDLPLKVSLRYTDPALDYEPGLQTTKRLQSPVPTQNSNNHILVEAPIVFTATEAKRITETLLYNARVGRSQMSFMLPQKFLGLDASDVVTLQLNDGTVHTLRLTKVEVGESLVLNVTGVPQEESIYTSTVEGDSGTSLAPDPKPVDIDTKLIILDSPLLRDVDEPANRINAVSYLFAAGSTGAGLWDYGVIMRSTDGEDYSEVGLVTTAMTYGYTFDALGDPENVFATDKTNTLTVSMITNGGNLNTVTTTEFLDGANAAALIKANGEVEVILFRDVTALGGSLYTLSYFARGMRGTDTMAFNHTAGEVFILLELEAGELLDVPLTDVDVARSYKAVSAGQYLEEATTQSYTLEGRSLMPYAPINITAVMNGSNVDLAWVRRDRLSTQILGGSFGTKTLNEDSEQYEIDFYNPITNGFLFTKYSEVPTLSVPQIDFAAAYPALITAGASITLTNAGGELGDMSGWTQVDGDDPVSCTANDANSGSYKFQPGANTVGRSRCYQDVDITAYATTTQLDSGQCLFNLSWYARRFASNQDMERCYAEALDSTGAVVGTISGTFYIGPNSASWEFWDCSDVLPKGTRTVRVYMDFLRRNSSGTYWPGLDDVAAQIFVPSAHAGFYTTGSPGLANGGFNGSLTSWTAADSGAAAVTSQGGTVPYEGTHFMAGGVSDAQARYYQDLSVSSQATEIDAGQMFVKLEGALACLTTSLNPNGNFVDQVMVQVRALDNGSAHITTLGQATLGEGGISADTWYPFSLILPVVKNTRTLRVYITMSTVTGNGCEVAVDGLTLEYFGLDYTSLDIKGEVFQISGQVGRGFGRTFELTAV